jgi:Tfp pilus assembly protein PilF
MASSAKKVTYRSLERDPKFQRKIEKRWKEHLEKGGVSLNLEKFIERRRQQAILNNFGTFTFRKDWNYKSDRVGREPRR